MASRTKGPALPKKEGWLRRWKSTRVLVLLVVLIVAWGWGLKQLRRREARRTWQRPVVVDVVMMVRGAVKKEAVTGFREALPRLESILTEEFARHRGEAMSPFVFVPHGPVLVKTLPPEVPEEASVVQRVTHFLSLRSYFREVESTGGLRLSNGGLHLYVVLEPTQSKVRFVEGFGALDGDFGVVHAVVDEGTIDQALVALAHEVLHCVGATDKYNEQGHARDPEGLVEPEARYPQRFAEVMVGEVPLTPLKGRLVESLQEMRVGVFTAEEIGWLSRPSR